MTDVLQRFASEVGPSGPVVAVGGRTQWDVGGSPLTTAREVVAPGGVVEHEPAEMIVRVRAATTVAELDAVLAGAGQMVPLDPVDAARATVGGVLAVGHSGPRRLRYGPVRDTVLEIVYVSAEGTLIKAGAPVVKNVSGYDLCRLLVGSLGTLGVLAEVVLRVQPIPLARQWLAADSVDPLRVRRRLYSPSSVLWNGTTTWVLLEGHPGDIAEESAKLTPEFAEVAGAPPLPTGGRVSVDPTHLASWCAAMPSGSFVAEMGVGTVHLAAPPERAVAGHADPVTACLCAEVKSRFDPSGRMNPGRTL